MKSVFDKKESEEILERINRLTASSKPLWGKMSVGQMLAHCNVTYEMAYENKHPKPNAFTRFLLKSFVKGNVVNEKSYPRNSRTGAQFIITETKNFETEKTRLQGYIEKTQHLGASHFEGKESNSFGKLSSNEWNNMFYKHLDHHLQQFGI